MGWAGMAMQVVGMAAKGYGAYTGAQGEQRMMNMDAKMADMDAGNILRAGQYAEQNVRLRTAAMKGGQRAQLAANGVDLGWGSATDILASTDVLGERDALTVRDNATRKAWAKRAEAGFARAGAKSISPGFSAFTGMMGDAGSVASSWYKYGSTQVGSDASMGETLGAGIGSMWG